MDRFERVVYGASVSVTAVLVLAIVLPLAVGPCVSVSDGMRRGVVTKFSRKGIIWKTYEGQMALGGLSAQGANIWEFSIREDNQNREELARVLEEAVVSGEQVTVKYTETLAVWPWVAGTRYGVQAVQAAGKE